AGTPLREIRQGVLVLTRLICRFLGHRWRMVCAAGCGRRPMLVRYCTRKSCEASEGRGLDQAWPSQADGNADAWKVEDLQARLQVLQTEVRNAGHTIRCVA